MAWRREGSVERVIPAPAKELYDTVADVTTVGQRSDECHTAEWLPGSAGPSVGARFRGHNCVGSLHWSRVCEVIEAEPGRRFAFRTVPERLDIRRADSTIWRYDFEPAEGGTLVRHSYRIVRLPLRPLQLLYARAMPHHTDMRPAMRTTLDRLADAVG